MQVWPERGFRVDRESFSRIAKWTSHHLAVLSSPSWLKLWEFCLKTFSSRQKSFPCIECDRQMMFASWIPGCQVCLFFLGCHRCSDLGKLCARRAPSAPHDRPQSRNQRLTTGISLSLRSLQAGLGPWHFFSEVDSLFFILLEAMAVWFCGCLVTTCNWIQV